MYRRSARRRPPVSPIGGSTVEADRFRPRSRDPVHRRSGTCDARMFSDMKRFSVFFVFGLITGLQQLSSDDGRAVAVAAADDTSVDVARQRHRDDHAAVVATGQTRSDLNTVENVLLRSASLLYGQMELTLRLALYKIQLLYTTFVVPIVSLLRQ